MGNSSFIAQKLGPLCSKIGSGATPRGGSKVYLEQGEITLIRSQNVRNEHFDKTGLVFIEEKHAKKLANVTVETGDVLLNITGDSVARCCQVDPSVLPARVNQHVAIIRPISDELDARFLRYFLVSPEMQNHMLGWAAAGGTRNALTKGMIESFDIPVPPLSEQRAIAHILGSLDDKIEINRKMSETLEAMAQAIFKSWFVDFDPVIDNALAAGNPILEALQGRAAIRDALGDERKPLPEEIRKHFPSVFELTEKMGWLPKGWEMISFGKMLSKTIGGDWGQEVADQQHSELARIIRGTDIPDLRTGMANSSPKRWVKKKKLDSRRLKDGDIVIEISGGSPKQPTGRSLYVTQSIIQRLGGVVAPASFCRLFRPITKEIGLIAGLHLDYIYRQGKMWDYQNQSTGIANFQTALFLEREIMAIPMSSELLTHFFNIVRPLIDKANDNQSIKLSNLRDTLLTKLISGELSISDSEKLVEQVL